MLNVTPEMLQSEVKQYSIKLPEKLHNALKADAAVNGKTKNAHIQNLILLGLKAKQ